MDKKVLNILAKLENTEKTSFSISGDTGILLNTIIRTAKFTKVLEIGTFYGYSAVWIADALKQTGGHVTTIEIEHERVVSARKLFEEVGYSNLITSIEGDAYEEISKLNGEFDLVFIDGGGDYLEIFNLVDKKLLKKNGLIAIDNANSPKHVAEDVMRVMEAMDKTERYQKIKLNLGTGFLLALKTD
jgi:predicted O-methyltransferase YrrM